jgi:lipopolysaccharide heptosyltransferase II
LNILLVRLRLIGDVVFTTPVIRALRRRFPAARLTYVVESGAAPVVAGNPHLTRVLAIPHARGWRRLVDDVRTARAIRTSAFDVAIDLHGGARSAWFTWASRAPMRVGYDVPGRQWMYTHRVHRPRELRPRHAVENQWDLLGAIDPVFRSGPSMADDRVEMPAAASASRTVSTYLETLGVPPSARMVVVHVSAGNPFRRWPEQSFAELAAGLVRAADDRWVLLTGGPSDRDAVGRVVRLVGGLAGTAAGRVLNAERISLAELRAVMDRASLFVGGDSGPLHVAATSDIPIVGLFGPTLRERSVPWRPPHLPTVSLDAGPLPCRPCHQRYCVPGDFRCLTRVSSTSVLDAAARLLEAR